MSAPPKTPRGPRWRELGGAGSLPGVTRWVYLLDGTPRGRPFAGIVVCSSLDRTEDDGDVWHVSISLGRWKGDGSFGAPEHANDDEVRFAIDAFRMRGAEEDNHARRDGNAGVARNFWLAVDPARRKDCQCKITEEVVRLPDGYTFTRPRRTG